MIQTEQALTREQALGFRHLPSTAAATRQLEERKAKGDGVDQSLPAAHFLAGMYKAETYTVAYYQDLVDRCVERDQAQATRPEGCWCFGLGVDPTDFEDGKARLYTSNFCFCPEGKAMGKAYRIILHQDHIAKVWAASGIPTRFRDFRLETSPLRVIKPGVDDENDLQDSYGPLVASILMAQGSLFLWGNYGTGKTGLAVGLAWFLVEAGDVNQVLFRSTPDLLSALRSTYGRSEGPTENDIIEQYATVPLLILDDMGAEQVKNSGWVEDRLYQIIGRRHGEELPTLFTSNLSIADLGARIGERIAWRIVEMCGQENIIHVQGPNLRDRTEPKTAAARRQRA